MKNFYISMGVNIMARSQAEAEDEAANMADVMSGDFYELGADASVISVESVEG